MVLVNILWPTFALVLIVFVVWFSMLFRRLGHMKRNPPTAATFENGASARDYFRGVDRPADNLANLFEMPVLYFALVPLLLLTQQASIAQVVLAWLFVLTRGVHSVIHIGANHIGANGVRPRLMIYLASTAILFAMWIGFFVDLASAAIAFSRAMRTGAGA